MFTGSIVALATPFAGKAVDERTLSESVRWQVEQGSAAVAVNTIVGEGPTLTAEERSRVISLASEGARGDVPVIAGICSNCTAQGMDEAEQAKAAGADALLLATPPYSRPSPEGVLRHLEAIAGVTDLPVLIQNEPARTRIDLAPESVARLAARANIVGFVDATGDLARALAPAHGLGRPVCTYTTQDALAAPFLMAGGTGAISVLANITPRLCAELHTAARDGMFSRATMIQRRLHPLIQALGADADPAAVKYALFLLRAHFDPKPRLPLVPAPCTTARAIAAALAGLRDESRYERG